MVAVGSASLRWLFVFALGVPFLQAADTENVEVPAPSNIYGDSSVVFHSPHSIVASCNGWLDNTQCPLRQDLSRGLRLHYRFNNASNLAQDSTKNGYDGKVVGQVTQTSGVIGGGAHFAGTFSKTRHRHYIEIPNVINRRAYTVAMWANLSSPNAHNSLLMLHGGSLAWSTSYLWIFTSNRRIAVIQNQLDIRYEDFPLPVSRTHPHLVPRFSRSPLMTARTWHHIAVTYSEGRLSAYLDGLLAYEFINVDSVAITPITQHLYVGDCLCQEASYEIKGSIDDLRVYDRALSPLEVKQLSR